MRVVYYDALGQPEVSIGWETDGIEMFLHVAVSYQPLNRHRSSSLQPVIIHWVAVKSGNIVCKPIEQEVKTDSDKNS